MRFAASSHSVWRTATVHARSGVATDLLAAQGSAVPTESRRLDDVFQRLYCGGGGQCHRAILDWRGRRNRTESSVEECLSPGRAAIRRGNAG